MSFLLGTTIVLGAGLIYTTAKIQHFKERANTLTEEKERESVYAGLYPIKRVLLRYHKLMEPHEFMDVAHQQARFRGIHGAIQAMDRLKGLLEAECPEVGKKTNILYLVNHHREFLHALSEKNDLVKRKLQEMPTPSERPPSPSDLLIKKGYLRSALDEYDKCLYKFDVEKCLLEVREIMEILRFYAPEVLVKPAVWEVLVRNEHFLIELVNLLPETCQKGLRTDAIMLESAG